MKKSIDAKDPLICNVSALRKAGRRMTQFYDAALAPCGLSASQRSFLVHIQRAGNPTMTELAHALVLDRSALARNIKPLERDGYVVQRPNPTDGRSRRVELTPAGQKKLAASTPFWFAAQSRFEQVFGVERAGALRVSLGEIFSDEFAEAFKGP